MMEAGLIGISISSFIRTSISGLIKILVVQVAS
jgi:hypothetical protein